MVLVPVTVTDHTARTVQGLVRSFVKTANPEDEFILLTVSTLPSATSEFITDTEAVEGMIASTNPGGFTALMDTVYLGLNRMRKAHNPRRALIVVSDGIDNHSRYSRSELLRVALEADIQIYSIVMNTGAGAVSVGNGAPFRPSMVAKPWDRGPQVQGPDLMEKLAEKTGGLFFHARNDAEVRDAMAKAGQALRNEYVIGYRMPDSSSSGKWHQVGVKSAVPKVNVHARTGYYAP
jgi:Ca-activated chloride channel family protein